MDDDGWNKWKEAADEYRRDEYRRAVTERNQDVTSVVKAFEQSFEQGLKRQQETFARELLGTYVPYKRRMPYYIKYEADPKPDPKQVLERFAEVVKVIVNVWANDVVTDTMRRFSAIELSDKPEVRTRQEKIAQAPTEASWTMDHFIQMIRAVTLAWASDVVDERVSRLELR